MKTILVARIFINNSPSTNLCYVGHMIFHILNGYLPEVSCMCWIVDVLNVLAYVHCIPWSRDSSFCSSRGTSNCKTWLGNQDCMIDPVLRTDLFNKICSKFFLPTLLSVLQQQLGSLLDMMHKLDMTFKCNRSHHFMAKGRTTLSKRIQLHDGDKTWWCCQHPKPCQPASQTSNQHPTWPTQEATIRTNQWTRHISESNLTPFVGRGIIIIFKSTHVTAAHSCCSKSGGHVSL